MWPLRPEAPKANPKESGGGAEYGFVHLSIEHCELMSERQVFQHEPGMGLKAGTQRAQHRENDIEQGGANLDGRR